MPLRPYSDRFFRQDAHPDLQDEVGYLSSPNTILSLYVNDRGSLSLIGKFIILLSVDHM